jgi:gamma-glutamylaminecyclotransferase
MENVNSSPTGRGVSGGLLHSMHQKSFKEQRINVPVPDSMPNTIPVFAYGTLKRGHGNHRQLEDATFLGEAVTAASYALHVDGLPMVDRNNPVSPIHGELYLVDDATFADLDRLEGHPLFYRRFLTRVSLVDGTVKAAWMYFGSYPSGPIVLSGRYEKMREDGT